ncbi:hydroxysteroid dehydrogenase-like protein 2 isoform X3 [Balaenoptera acutorostrata]|uniref:Hydroxysteroid dehydrogenase-like protein 2 n=1 Tax=Balaenoptera acutorostrata TaxID=9767 RepID=A0ABM3TPA9_BALAC|nr:hydroxysteroid dehydrogenase-like protein 2 isoform X3 [Balaenoptera acutorostrata]
MLPNTGKLAGCTVFITGASRGIGKAIALKAAKDGANIVIAAKTAQAHPKLAGTIYSAAEEIKAAGGKALPCVVDVRDEQQISSAVEKAVEKFGGIDILVNNASAISLTNTLETPTKKVDLMMNVNTRGTYLTSKACIPYLKKSKIAHILNLSPPLNLNPLWFKQHCAYTIAKYGMSLCVLGMAEEFKGEIAVNALWPKTGALPELKEEEAQPSPKPRSGAVEGTFRIVKDSLSDDVVKATQAIYQFELSGEDGGTWFLDLKSKGGNVGYGEPSDRADVVMSMSTDDFVKMFSGKLKPTIAFMSGRLKIKGNMALAIKLEKLMNQMNARL